MVPVTVDEARSRFADLPVGSIDVRTASANPGACVCARLADRGLSAGDGGRGAFIAIRADRR